MKGMMFDTDTGLNTAVLDGYKVMTRRLQKIPTQVNGVNVESAEIVDNHKFGCVGSYIGLYDINHDLIGKVLPSYLIGEEVAVQMSYKTAVEDTPECSVAIMDYTLTRKKPCDYRDHFGYNNKMYVNPKLMPNRIKITNQFCQHLCDISDTDCMKEGIVLNHEANGSEYYTYGSMSKPHFNTTKEAYRSLINKLSKYDIWTVNPIIFAYEFEVVYRHGKYIIN